MRAGKASRKLCEAAPDLLEALEAAVKNKVIGNFFTAKPGRYICLICGKLPKSRKHDEDCWVPMAQKAIAKAKEEELNG